MNMTPPDDKEEDLSIDQRAEDSEDQSGTEIRTQGAPGEDNATSNPNIINK